MIALWILLGILGFIFGIIVLVLVLSLFSIRIDFAFSEEASLSMRYLFIRIPILPPKEEKEPKPKKSKKEKPPKKKKRKKKKGEKQPSPIMTYLKEKKVKGILDILKEAVTLLTGTLWRIAKHIRFKVLVLEMAVSTDDAAETAIQYGKICSVVYPSAKVIVSLTKCKEYLFDIRPDFDGTETRIRAKAIIKLRPIVVLAAAIRLLVKALFFMKQHKMFSLFKAIKKVKELEDMERMKEEKMESRRKIIKNVSPQEPEFPEKESKNGKKK